MKFKYLLTKGLKFIASGGSKFFASHIPSVESNNSGSFNDCIDLRTARLNKPNLGRTLNKISSNKNIGHIMWNNGEVSKIRNDHELQKLKEEIM